MGFKYKPGDRIGPNNILFLEYSTRKVDKSRSSWNNYGIFECPYCGDPFVTTISTVSCGKRKTCDKCGRERSNQAKVKDLTGMRFGKLTVIKQVKDNSNRKSRSSNWLCLCDCGNYKIVPSPYLKSGDTQSCGCIKSVGEEKIIYILQNMNIQYTHDCAVFETELFRPDFYFSEQKTVIEFDGIQHFEYNNKGWRTKNCFLQTKKQDKVKNQFYINHGIACIRIPYWELNNIDEGYIKNKLKIAREKLLTSSPKGCIIYSDNDPRREGVSVMVNKYIYSERAQAIVRFLQKNADVDYTGRELASALTDAGTQITARQVTGVVNGLVKKDVLYRTEVNNSDDDDTKVKVIRLTDKGSALTEDDLTEISPKYLEAEEKKKAKTEAKVKEEPVGADENITF